VNPFINSMSGLLLLESKEPFMFINVMWMLKEYCSLYTPHALVIQIAHRSFPLSSSTIVSILHLPLDRHSLVSSVFPPSLTIVSQAINLFYAFNSNGLDILVSILYR
jgi:hypothetical protein